MSTSTPTDRITTIVSDLLPEALDLSHRVHANPEIAYEERQARALGMAYRAEIASVASSRA